MERLRRHGTLPLDGDGGGDGDGDVEPPTFCSVPLPCSDKLPKRQGAESEQHTSTSSNCEGAGGMRSIVSLPAHQPPFVFCIGSARAPRAGGQD
jgi:hypothetical protein